MIELNEAGTSKRSIARVSVGFKAESLRVAEITRLVGLQPSRSYEKGDLSARTRTPMPWGMWAIEFETDDVESAAKRLLDVLGQKRDAIVEAARQTGATVSVGIWWEPEGGQGGFTLGSETLKQLSELGERVNFYFPG
jgi:hypothetical protein